MSTLPLTTARIRTAKDIMIAGLAAKVGTVGIEIAYMTSCVEAGLSIAASAANPSSLSYPHDWVAAGDYDSVGPFQQRNAWGSMRERMTTVLSAGLFFNGGHEGQRGLKDFPYTSTSRTKGHWAQSVQVSAFPDRYDAYDSFGEYVASVCARLMKPAPHWNDKLPVYDTSQLIALQQHPDGEQHSSISNVQAGLKAWSVKAIEAKVPGASAMPPLKVTGQWNVSSRFWAQVANQRKGFGNDGWFGPKGLAWISPGRYHLLAD